MNILKFIDSIGQWFVHSIVSICSYIITGIGSFFQSEFLSTYGSDILLCCAVLVVICGGAFFCICLGDSKSNYDHGCSLGE